MTQALISRFLPDNEEVEESSLEKAKETEWDTFGLGKLVYADCQDPNGAYFPAKIEKLNTNKHIIVFEDGVKMEVAATKLLCVKSLPVESDIIYMKNAEYNNNNIHPVNGEVLGHKRENGKIYYYIHCGDNKFFCEPREIYLSKKQVNLLKRELTKKRKIETDMQNSKKAKLTTDNQKQSTSKECVSGRNRRAARLEANKDAMAKNQDNESGTNNKTLSTESPKIPKLKLEKPQETKVEVDAVDQNTKIENNNLKDDEKVEEESSNSPTESSNSSNSNSVEEEEMDEKEEVKPISKENVSNGSTVVVSELVVVPTPPPPPSQEKETEPAAEESSLKTSSSTFSQCS